ncbi:MAG: hypothetical protein AAF726_01230 [Planctomycetota bacterium]
MLLSLAPLVVAAALPAADDFVLRWHDLRAFFASNASTLPGVDLSLHLSSARIDALEPESYDVWTGPEARLKRDDAARLIQAAIDATPGAEVRSVVSRDGLVRVTGNEAAQAAAASAVAALSAAGADAAVVEVHRVDRDAIPSGAGAVLDRSAVAALLESDGVALAARSTARIGRDSRLGEPEIRSFVWDYDVEAAQGALGVDPAVSVLRTGLEVGARVDRAADGQRFVVQVWGRDGSIADPIRTIDLEALGGTPVELPEVATSVWAMSGIVEPGGAILVNDGDDGALLLRITGDAEAPAGLVPIGANAIPGMRPQIPWLPRTSPTGGLPIIDGANDALESFGFADVGAFEAVLSDAFIEVTVAGHAQRYGTSLVLTGPDEVTAPAREAARALAEALPEQAASIELRYDLVPAAELAAAIADPTAFAAAAESSISASSIVGGAALLVGGVETAYLQDFDVQVAQGAQVPDPNIGIAFDGFALWCAPLPGANDARPVWFDFQLHANDPETRTLELANYTPAPTDGAKDLPRAMGTFDRTLSVELPTTSRAAARTLLNVADGVWTNVTAQPMPGTDQALVVVARVVTR